MLLEVNIFVFEEEKGDSEWERRNPHGEGISEVKMLFHLGLGSGFTVVLPETIIELNSCI